jgi:hypothetical protein
VGTTGLSRVMSRFSRIILKVMAIDSYNDKGNYKTPRVHGLLS